MLFWRVCETSQVGLRRSYGLMAHYCYSDFDALDERASQYAADGAPRAALGALTLPDDITAASS